MNSLENDIFNFDPAITHKKLTEQIRPAMCYQDGDVKQWQRILQTKLLELLGMNNMPEEKCELNVRSQWSRACKYGTIEKIVFSSEPDHDVPAYVCLPVNAKAPYTFFICLQGHSSGMHNSIAVDLMDENREIQIEGDRDFGIGCMKRGIAALCIEQRGFGECNSICGEERVEFGCREHSLAALMLGRTLMGERVFDVDRAIDYLETRNDARKKIGIMGNSGGGTVSMFAGGLLDRLSYVMLSSCFSSFKKSIMAIPHCICNYIPSLLSYADCSDVAALAYPKPLVIVNGKDDEIFPVGSAQNSFKKVNNIYKQGNAANNCVHVLGDGGHQFYADSAWNAMENLIQKNINSGVL